MTSGSIPQANDEHPPVAGLTNCVVKALASYIYEAVEAGEGFGGFGWDENDPGELLAISLKPLLEDAAKLSKQGHIDLTLVVYPVVNFTIRATVAAQGLTPKDAMTRIAQLIADLKVELANIIEGARPPKAA